MEFTEDKGGLFYLIIDSKAYEISVEFESIENISETKDGKLNLQYYVPGDNGNMMKRNEMYDCFEHEEFVKVYLTIKTQLNMNSNASSGSSSNGP